MKVLIYSYLYLVRGIGFRKPPEPLIGQKKRKSFRIAVKLRVELGRARSPVGVDDAEA